MTGTVERARGRWREILPQLGIETRFSSISMDRAHSAAGKIGFDSMIAMAAGPIIATNADRASGC
jgi:hypothetical protein